MPVLFSKSNQCTYLFRLRVNLYFQLSTVNYQLSTISYYVLPFHFLIKHPACFCDYCILVDPEDLLNLVYQRMCLWSQQVAFRCLFYFLFNIHSSASSCVLSLRTCRALFRAQYKTINYFPFVKRKFFPIITMFLNLRFFFFIYSFDFCEIIMILSGSFN